MRPTVLCGLRASSMKKSLAGQAVQLGSHIPSTHMHVSKALDVRAIMGLQDMRGGSVINACKMCG
jgi:hypothetical protein